MQSVAKLRFLILLVYLFSMTHAHAKVSASFASQLGYTDNLLKTSDKISTMQQSLQAQLNMVHQWRQLNSNCGLSVSGTRYQASQNDNIANNHFHCVLSYQPSSQHTMSLNAGYNNADETRGSGISKNAPNNIDQPDQYTNQNLNLTYLYQTSPLQGFRFSSSIKLTDKNYQSARSLALQNNRQQNKLDLIVGYQSRKNTYWFTHYGISNSRFNEAEHRNNNVNTLALGLAWQATAITGFKAELGQQNKVNDDHLNKNASNKSEYWSISATWAPKTYSVFTLNSRSYYQSSVLTDSNTQQNQTLSLDWRHSWNNRLDSQVGMSYQKYDQDSQDNRIEKLKSFNMSVAYTLNNRIKTKLSWQLQNNQDNLRQYSFRQQQIFLTFNLAWQT